MNALGVVIAVLLIVVVLFDMFETMVLPRRISHPYRLARAYYRLMWIVWRATALRIRGRRWRNGFLSGFGPLSLFGLLAVWVIALVVGFAFLQWSLATPLNFVDNQNFFTYIYFSATTFFTLGYGDVVAIAPLGRMLSVFEAGIGFGFFAVAISYLPVLYQAFSRREITISLLDARAGSPPTAGELLRRVAEARAMHTLGPLLVEWERWASELLESHVSFPVLRFYRSQHDNQSWVSTLALILDTTALLIAAVEESDDHQARLTFAMARHAAVDLGLVTQTRPLAPPADRLPSASYARLRQSLAGAGMALREGPAVEKALCELRKLYEPFVHALANQILFELPTFEPARPPVDNWQTSPWMQRSPELGRLPAGVEDDHID